MSLEHDAHVIQYWYNHVHVYYTAPAADRHTSRSMRRIFQTILEAPHGNALQACVASLLGLPMNDVPNFVEAEDYWESLLTHAGTLGLTVLKIPLVAGRLPFPSVPGTRCIARGESPRGTYGHVIVAIVGPDGLSLVPIHDPHPDGGFLAGPAAWVAVYGGREPELISQPHDPYATLAAELRADGLDVIAPLRVSWYNDYLRELGLSTDSTKYLEASGEAHASGEAAPFAIAPLPDYGRSGNALAFLIGNSRALWPSLLSWMARQSEPSAVKDPVDTYAGEVVRRSLDRYVAAVATAAGAAPHPLPAYDVFWAHDMSPARLVDMNRASRVSGMCYFSDEMFLSVHPTFGSWVAFRAVVVVDLPATHLGPPPAHLPSLLTDEETAAAKAAFAAALDASSKEEMSVDGMPLHLAHKWAAMRDCVRLGRQYRYSDAQSEYHYTKDARRLLAAVEGLGKEQQVAAEASAAVELRHQTGR